MDLYDVLEIEPDATPSEIKQAYHRLAQKYHPDKGGNPELFQRVKKAYEILKDKYKRVAYDKTKTTDNLEIEEKAITEIAKLFAREISFSMKLRQSQTLKRVNREIDKFIANLKSEKDNLRKQLKSLDLIYDDVITTDRQNIYTMCIDEVSQQISDKLLLIETELKTMKLAKNLLKTYKDNSPQVSDIRFLE